MPGAGVMSMTMLSTPSGRVSLTGVMVTKALVALARMVTLPVVPV